MTDTAPIPAETLLAARIIEAVLDNRVDRVIALSQAHPELDLRQALNTPIPDAGHVPYRDPETMPVLHFAAKYGQHQMVAALLAAGADPLAPDAQGYTALHLACRDGNVDCVRALLAGGAKVDHCNEGHPYTPLTCAVWPPQRTQDVAPYEEIICLLLAAGADANARNIHGCTVLYSAAVKGMDGTVAQLLAHKANPLLSTDEDLTPLDGLVYWKRNRFTPIEKTAQLLIPAMLAPELWHGKTASDAARLWAKIPKEWRPYGQEEIGELRRFLARQGKPPCQPRPPAPPLS